MAVNDNPRSITDILADAASEFTTLISKEAQLARTELSEKITDLALGFGLLVGGAVLLIPALVILLQAAVDGIIAAGLQPAWAALIVGGATLAIGFILLAIGINRLKAAKPVPTKVIAQLHQDAEVAKRQLRNDYDTTQRAA